MIRLKIKYSLFIIFHLIGIMTVVAQEGSKISKKYNSSSIRSQSDSRVMETRNYLKEAQDIFDEEPDRAFDLVHDALLIDIKENYLEEEADAYKLLGDFNFELKEYSLSVKNYEKAIAIYEQLSLNSRSGYISENKLLRSHFGAANSAQLEEDYANSILHYSYCYKESKRSKDKEGVVRAQIGMGVSHLRMGKLDEAESNLLDALKTEQKRDNKSNLVVINLHLGELEEARSNQEQAIVRYRTSQNSAVEIEDDKAVNDAYGNISRIYQAQDNTGEQIKIGEEALEYNQRRNNEPEISANNIGLANLLLEQNQGDKAIEKLNNTIELTEKNGDIKNQSKAVEALAKAYHQEGNLEESLKKLNEYKSLKDSIKKIETDIQINQIRKEEIIENAQNKLTILEKDKELNERTIELLRKDKIIQDEYISRQRTITWSLLSGILILLITSYLVFRSNREKNKANQLLALKSLRAQMNPHFIFNALNSVNSFISNNNEKEANRYLSEFSRLMRDVMENSQEDFIPLSKEINILQLYLKLEHDRFSDKFEYNFEVDKSIDIEETTIPPMLVQPYIENAVWHGLRYKEEKGLLEVKITKDGDATLIKVSDNGIGRKRSAELKTKNQKTLKSTGIKNIDSRLKIIRDVYKTKLDIKISDLDQANNSGTLVEIRLFEDKK